MLTYLRMKKNQWKTKAFLYGITARILDEHQDMITLVSDIYTALKDIPAEELQKELAAKLAETIHRQNTADN